MPTIAKLVVSLGADTADFQTDLQRAQKISEREMRKLERQAKRVNDQWNRNFKAAGLAVAGGLALATKAAIDFEKSMSEISTLLDSDVGMKDLAAQVKAVSLEFGKSTADEAKALYQIISAGATTATERTELLAQANKLAVGGLTDVSTAADGLTSVYNAYAAEGLEAARITDIMFETMRQGKTTIEELNASIGSVATIAAQTGLSFEELSASLATITSAGINTSQAAEGMRGVLSALLKQTDKTREAAAQLGIQFDIDRLRAVKFAGIMQDISSANGGLGATEEQLSALIGRVEGLTTFMAAATQGGDLFNEKLLAIKNSAGIADKAVAKVMETTAFKVDQARAAFEQLGIEIGTKFLSSISNMATVFVDNIDRIILAVEALVAIITVRVGVAVVASFMAASQAAGVMATTMAIAGGAMGAWVLAATALVANLYVWLPGVFQVSEAHKLLDEQLSKAEQTLGLLGTNVADTTDSIIDWKDAALEAAAALRKLNAVESLRQRLELERQAIEVAKELEQIQGRIAKERSRFIRWTATLEGLIAQEGELKEKLERTIVVLKQLSKGEEAAATSAEKLKDGAAGAVEWTDELGKSLSGLLDSLFPIEAQQKKWNAQLDELEQALKAGKVSADKYAAAVNKIKAAQFAASPEGLANQLKTKFTPAINDANKVLEEALEIFDEITEEQNRYERSIESLIDTLNPVQAAAENFAQELADLGRYAEEAGWSQDQLNDAVAKLNERFDKQVNSIRGVVDGFDFLTAAIDEGTRILERTFTRIWDSLLEGSGEAFDAIKDGFKAMLANLANQAITQPIMVNIQQGLRGQGTGPGGGINYQQLGTDLAAFAGVIAGTKLGGDSQWAAYGATFGAMAGAAIGTAFLGPGIGTAIGSFVGGIWGGIYGKFLGKIFGKDKTPRIVAGTGFDVKPGDSQFFGSAFGGISVGDTKGGMDDYVQDFGNALQAFDDSIASFLNDDQIGAITNALDGWTSTLRGKNITIEDLLNNRFTAIMSTFNETIQGFVSDGEDLAQKAERLQVATSAETLIGDNADLFGDRTLGEFLAIVDAFKSGNQTIAEAYNEVLELLNIITPVYQSLQAFRDSNLGEDFAAIIAGANVTLQQALTGMINGLDDAIRNFDGSPEQLQNIGLMVASIREGELKLLAEIDQIQKGISANLASLKSDLLGLNAPELTGEQLFNQAAGLIGQLQTASSAAEVAELARQFEATIRQMSPEDQARNASELVRMVEDFDKVQTEVLEGMKQAVLDSAADTRALVEDFIERIGTPLDILVGSNQEVADALGDGGAFEQMQIDNETHQSNVETILETGVEDIAGAVGSIGPTVANAVQRALQGTDINVQVVVNGGLVTQ